MGLGAYSSLTWTLPGNVLSTFKVPTPTFTLSTPYVSYRVKVSTLRPHCVPKNGDSPRNFTPRLTICSHCPPHKIVTCGRSVDTVTRFFRYIFSPLSAFSLPRGKHLACRRIPNLSPKMGTHWGYGDTVSSRAGLRCEQDRSRCELSPKVESTPSCNPSIR